MSRMPDHACAIELPDEAARRQRLVQHPGAAVAGHAADAIGLTLETAMSRFGRQLDDADDERVARRRALDVEGPDLARPGPGDLRIVVVAGAREGFGLDGVARLHGEHRRPHREGGDAGGRLVLVRFGRDGARQREHSHSDRCEAHGADHVTRAKAGRPPRAFTGGAGDQDLLPPVSPLRRSYGIRRARERELANRAPRDRPGRTRSPEPPMPSPLTAARTRSSRRCCSTRRSGSRSTACSSPAG